VREREPIVSMAPAGDRPMRAMSRERERERGVEIEIEIDK